jgi:hypothetical protein
MCSRLSFRHLLAAGALAAAVGLAATPLAAGHRTVIVNGALLGPQELMIADRNAGFPLPDGRYWYDPQSGYWGPEGGPAAGQVPPHLRGGGAEPGWSYRNDNAGVGGVFNPDGATWEDQVWIDWD